MMDVFDMAMLTGGTPVSGTPVTPPPDPEPEKTDAILRVSGAGTTQLNGDYAKQSSTLWGDQFNSITLVDQTWRIKLDEYVYYSGTGADIRTAVWSTVTNVGDSESFGGELPLPTVTYQGV